MSEMNKQLRHWMITLWPKPNTKIEELLLEVENLVRSLEPSYSIFQMEYGCESQVFAEGIHVQLYIEFFTSIRGKTVANKFNTLNLFKPSHVEGRDKSRTACRKYCSKTMCDKDGHDHIARIEETEPIEIGKWREEEISKQKIQMKTCAELIEAGYDAPYIAMHYPHLFLKYGNRITTTIFYRGLYQKGESPFAETKNDEEE